MGLINKYESLNGVTVYKNAYYVFVDYDELIRNFDDTYNSVLPPIFWKKGHHINPIFLVYENKIEKLKNSAPIGLLTGHHTGKVSAYVTNEQIANINIVFLYDETLNTSIEEQSYNFLKTMEYYSNGIIE